MELVNLSTILVVVGFLMVLTNIITEVLKKLFWDKIPTNLLVVLIALVLTLATGAAYAQIMSIEVLWYYVVAAVVVAFLVAYAAMFGFDKLKQALEQMGVQEHERRNC